MARRSGCGLLLDVNNVHVSATNQRWDACAYLDAFPLALVREIHLAGHAREADAKDEPLLIDTHDRPVDVVVWDLFAHVIDRIGPVPTLIEWDADLPSWPVLLAEAERAEAVMLSRPDAGARRAGRGAR